MIHFAGLNTAGLAKVLEGRAVLVSYADVVRRPGVWEREIRPRLEAGAYASVILDSGAYTELAEVRKAQKEIARREGCRVDELTRAQLAEAERIGREAFHVDVEAYGRFALDHADLFDLVVNLDDIRGDLKRTRRNQAYLESLGLEVLPVYHQGEPWSELERLVRRYGYIGIGFQRPITGARRWLEEVFRRVGGRARIHGFGMVRYELEGFPFETTDSTTWIAEYRALRTNLDGREGSHGLRGKLASWASLESLERLFDLVLDSYHGPVSWAPALVEDQAVGQARTVLRRANV